MIQNRNSLGTPLSGAAWLETHHRAKLAERRAFAERILDSGPQRIVDLGCGTGLWLDVIDEVADATCEFIGIDLDEDSLSEARARSTTWSRTASFVQLDVDRDQGSIPEADVYLLFNIFSYLREPGRLLTTIQELRPREVFVRQYDGDSLRFGPLQTRDRGLVEDSLRDALLASEQFSHYDMDRAYRTLVQSDFETVSLRYELYQRFGPFTSNDKPYIDAMLEWTRALVSDRARPPIDRWLADSSSGSPCYFLEVDLVGVLS